MWKNKFLLQQNSLTQQCPPHTPGTKKNEFSREHLLLQCKEAQGWDIFKSRHRRSLKGVKPL